MPGNRLRFTAYLILVLTLALLVSAPVSHTTVGLAAPPSPEDPQPGRPLVPVVQRFAEQGPALQAQSDPQATVASLPDGEELVYIGHIDGYPTGAIAVKQGLTAIAFHERILFFETSGGAAGNLQPTGSLFLPEPVQTMVFHDNYLYASTPSYFLVVDVSVPANPRVARVFYTGFSFSHLEVEGNLLIGISQGGAGQYLDLISLELPGEPQYIVSYIWEGRLLGIENQTIYRLYDNQVEYIPLTNLENLYLYYGGVLPDYDQLAERTWNFAMNGQILYAISSYKVSCYQVCRYDNYIYAWSLAKPAKPTKLGQAWLETGKLLGSLSIYGTSAAVAAEDTVHVIDMSQPGVPVSTGVYQAPAKILDARLFGTQVHLVGEKSGLQVVDFGGGQSPRLRGEYLGTGRVEAMELGPGIALTWSNKFDRQFLAYDLTDFDYPRRIEIDLGESRPLDVVYREDLVYVLLETTVYSEDWRASTIYTLRILDPAGQPPFKQIAALELPERYDFNEYVRGRIRFNGDMLFAFFGEERISGELIAIDISDPANPVQVLEMGFGEVRDIAFSDGYAFVLAGYHEPKLRIFDVRSPGAFTEVGAPLNISGEVIQVAGEYAFVAGSDTDEITVLDISQPDAPVVVSRYLLYFDWLKDLQVWGRYLLVANNNVYEVYQRYLAVIDAGHPEQLRLAAIIQHPNDLCDVAADGDIIALATCEAGVDFLSLTNRLPEPQSVSLTPDSSQRLEFNYRSGETLSLDFPTAAVSETITVTVTPVRTADQPKLLSTGLGFHLSARGAAPLSFGEPVTVTITYSDETVRTISNEAQLRLLHLNGSGSPDASQSCSEPQAPQRDLRANRFSTVLCQPGTYGLYGPTNWLYLPSLLNGVFHWRP